MAEFLDLVESTTDLGVHASEFIGHGGALDA